MDRDKFFRNAHRYAIEDSQFRASDTFQITYTYETPIIDERDSQLKIFLVEVCRNGDGKSRTMLKIEANNACTDAVQSILIPISIFFRTMAFLIER